MIGRLLVVALCSVGGATAAVASPVAIQNEPPEETAPFDREPAPAPKSAEPLPMALAPAASATATLEQGDPPFDPCTDPRPRRDWLDRFGYRVYRTVCGSAQWLDGFFGGDRGLREADSSYGRVGFGTAWDDAEGMHFRGRFKARVNFPRMENRLNAFLGRFEEDEFVSGQSDDAVAVPANFREVQEKDWLLGFGYNPVRSARGRLDVDAGIKVDFPIDPFVKVSYRYYLFVSNTRLLRLGQTVFWTNHLGTGTTSRIDYEKALGDRFHIRWLGLGTVAQEVDGIDWLSSFTVYHYLGDQKAIAWVAEINGETKAPIELEEYGLRAVYRQQFLRDDLFLELQGRVFWPQLEPEGERETAFGVGVGFELLWGRQDLQEARDRFRNRRNRQPPPPAAPVPPTRP